MNVMDKYHINDLSKRDEKEDIIYFRVFEDKEITNETIGIYPGVEETVTIKEMIASAKEKTC